MDSHVKGPAVNGYGAVSGYRGLRTLFGTTPSGVANRRLLLKTTGAGVNTPLLVKLLQQQKVAFNGTAPDVAIVSENLDGTSPVTETNIAAIVAGGPEKTILCTVDRAFYVLYTLATGAPTQGDIYSWAAVNGQGPT